MVFTPYRLYHKPPLRGGIFLAALSPREKLGALPRRVGASMVAKRVMKEEDGVPCAIYKRPKQMMVKVGSGSSGDSFVLRAQGCQVGRRQGAGPQAYQVCGHRFSSSVNILLRSAPDFELTDDAGS